MKALINEVIFDKNDPQKINFFNEHGWVVIKAVFSPQQISSALKQLHEMKQEFAHQLNLTINEYEREISQWRDLWLGGQTFREIVFENGGIHHLAKESMQWLGIRLLHDHIIAKPYNGSNKKIPWHQDSMFWPVDLPGCSTWAPLENIEVDGGCLEVLDKSHLQGCEDPLDFMAEEKSDFDDKLVHIKLPVKAGWTVLLHSLTWHRSSPSRQATSRPVHIALWIHPDTKWRPDLVDWHPLNEFVEANPKFRLEGKRFPVFGIIENIAAPSKDIHHKTFCNVNNISMFNASKKIGDQIAKILNQKGNLYEMLSNEKNREKIITAIVNKRIFSNKKKLRTLLQKLWIDHKSYSIHRARNVYNDTYADWWNVVGRKLEENDLKSSFKIKRW